MTKAHLHSAHRISGTVLLAVSVLLLIVALKCQPALAQQSDEAAGLVKKDGRMLGEDIAARITVKSANGEPLCPSFSFSQIPDLPNLFIGKLKGSTPKGVCAGNVTLALFKLDWSTGIMTFLHTVVQVPFTYRNATIIAAYDPFVLSYKGKSWVAFECVGLHLSGTSSCIAPLVDQGGRVDTNRMTVPVVGDEGGKATRLRYSASTPKLLEFKSRVYLYWSAIESEKDGDRRWLSVETRGAELELGSDDQMWVKGHAGREISAHAHDLEVPVMTPDSSDPLRNMSVDTEGLFTADNRIIALNSVGGAGEKGDSPCTKPIDDSPGCYRLEITRTDEPLEKDSFKKEVMISPEVPVNPVEYPRLVTAPDKRTYLMINVHGLRSKAASDAGKVIEPGLFLVPFSISSAKFQTTERHPQ